MTSEYAAIILAAGLSSRMKDFKPLMKIGGVTIADRVISLFNETGLDVILVTGWRGDELVTGIENREITVAENPVYETGMLSSVQAGVRKLEPEHKAFLMMPVDIPLVRPATVMRILACAGENPGKIIYPVFGGKHGHPPVIPASLADEISGWSEEGGLNAILRKHKDIQLEFQVADGNVLADADDRDDFSRLIARFESMDIPSEAECQALLDIAETPENIRKHCLKVAEVAGTITGALLDTGCAVDAAEVHAASVLHDVARVMPDHAVEGAKVLAEHGFSRIGEIVSIHQYFVDETDSVDMESKVVFLADKMVNGEDIVSLEARYLDSLEKYGTIPEVAERIKKRLDRAVKVNKEITDILGYPPERLVA